jgi:hypothetical protein
MAGSLAGVRGGFVIDVVGALKLAAYCCSKCRVAAHRQQRRAVDGISANRPRER